jgi:hypothetical protein
MPVDIHDNTVINGRLPVPVTWTSDSSGDATVILPYYKGFDLVAVMVAPGKYGDLTTDVPTDDYSIEITNACEEDIMDSMLSACSNSEAQTIYANPPIQVPSVLTVSVSGAGDTNQGVLVLYLTKN